MKKLASLALALALCVSLLPFPAAAADETDSGCADVPKLTKEEIYDLLEDNPNTMPSTVFDAEPSVTAPYSTGAVNMNALQRAVNRLNALRQLAGLPPVALDAALCEEAQYGAVLLAASDFSHRPAKPDDMEEAFYERGKAATSSSNISAGRYVTATPDAFMNDADPSNMTSVGHRRWQLNPTLGKVGFGYAFNANSYYHRYTSEVIKDRSGKPGDYDYIAWPSSGNFPEDLIWWNIPWSVTLNPSKYQQPNASDVTVTLTRASDGRTWTFSGAKSYTAATRGEYFNVETSGYGVPNCIIFRPDGVEYYEGVYTVEIKGIRTSSGAAATLRYSVDFFLLADAVSPYVEPFTDVCKTDSYADAVKWAVTNGVTKGTGDGTTFSPEMTCSRAQVVTFLWNLARQPAPQSTEHPFTDIPAGGLSDWYLKAMYWAVEQGITTGTGDGTTFSPDDPCTREQVLTFLHRYLDRPAARGESELANRYVTDWYTPALAWAQTNGVLGDYWYNFTLFTACPRADIVSYMYRAVAE